MKKAILFLALVGSQAGADGIATGSNQTIPPVQETPKTFSSTLLIDTSSTLAPGSLGATNSAGEGYSQSGFYRLDLKARLPLALTASIRTGYSQEYSYVNDDGTTGGLIDTRLGLSKAWGEIARDLKLSSALNLYLPTSKESQQSRMKSAIGASLNTEYTLGKFKFELIPGYTQYFHEVEVRDDGKLNIQNSVSLASSITYEFTDKVSAGITFWPSHGWTYQQTTRDNYILIYEIDYTISKTFEVDIGLMNKASALKDTGMDYNYTLYDQSQMTGYIDLVVNI